MTPAEIKAAATAKIVELDEALTMHSPVDLNLAADRVPDDARAERLLAAADAALTKAGRHVTVRHVARIRELLSRYVSA